MNVFPPLRKLKTLASLSERSIYFDALHESAAGTFETCRDVCSTDGYWGMSGLLADSASPSRLKRRERTSELL